MHIIRVFIAGKNTIEKLADACVVEVPDEFGFFTSSVAYVMEENSFRSKIAYVGREYFGGIGGQGGVLYMDGKMTIAPTWENGIGLGSFRSMKLPGKKKIKYNSG